VTARHEGRPLAKSKKKGAREGDGPAELLVIEAEQFPSSVIVELWHRTAKGKREFLDSRRFEVVEERAAAHLADEPPDLSLDEPDAQLPIA
jgi:hypothetical protein